MNSSVIFSSKFVVDLGWTLLHSFWQIALITLALYAFRALTQRAAASTRYAAAVFALAACVMVPAMMLLSRTMTGDEAAVRTSVVELQNDVEQGELLPDRDLRAHNATDQPSRAGRVSTATATVEDYLPVGLPMLVAIWFFGVALSTLRLCVGVSQVVSYRRRGILPPDSDWAQRFSSLCAVAKVNRRVRLLGSELLSTPVAIGILKPLILVPAAVFTQMSPAEIETIIAHELVHIRRYDPLVNLLQNIVETILFYHPCVWWISREIRREREFAADAAVVDLFKDSHIVYASALANLEAVRQQANFDVPRLAAAANGGKLMQRIQRILNKKTEMNSGPSAWYAFGALALISAVLLCVFSFSSRVTVNAQDTKHATGRKLAIGFVGIPPVDRSSDPPKDADATARILIAKLQQYKVPAIGFLTGSMISDGTPARANAGTRGGVNRGIDTGVESGTPGPVKLFPVRAEMVRMWRDAGLEVGLGGFKHQPFHDEPLDAYIANIAKNEVIGRQILAEKGLQPRYFSYPYLYTRKNDDHQKFEAWLQSRGLTSVKYTIDNNEWMYSYAYDMARNDNDVNTMKEIRAAYLEYMTKMFDHYEAYSQEMFGRDIPETMVLTPSRLVADSADDFFEMVKARGYALVSMDIALNDDAFKTEERYEGDNGISWFERWTLTAGKRLRNEPEIDPMVQKIWDKRKP